MPLDDSLRDAVNDVRLQAEELFPERGNLTYVIGKLVLPTHLLADGHDHQTSIGRPVSTTVGSEEMNTSDGDACPHCGLDLPESGPPMCPRCGTPR